MLLPVKSRKTKISKRFFYYLVILHNKKYAMNERIGKDIWKGLYDFPLIETKKPVAELALKKLIPIPGAKEVSRIGPIKHILSHQHLFIYFLTIKASSRALEKWSKESKMKFYSASQVSKLPKPVVIARFLSEKSILR